MTVKSIIQNLPRPPSKEERHAELAGQTRNPLKLIAMLTPLQGAQFFAGWLAWTIDAYGRVLLLAMSAC